MPQNNPEALAEALGKLAHNPELRQTLGEQARHIVSKHHDRRQMVRGYMGFYREVLKRPLGGQADACLRGHVDVRSAPAKKHPQSTPTQRRSA